MDITFQKKMGLITGSLVVAVVLLLSIFKGLSVGKSLRAAEIISGDAASAKKALDFFYSDQNRFPSESEFADRNIMIQYFSNFPLPEIPSSSCSQTFIYKRPSLKSYQLNFCLPRAINNYNQGWNSITVDKTSNS